LQQQPGAAERGLVGRCPSALRRVEAGGFVGVEECEFDHRYADDVDQRRGRDRPEVVRCCSVLNDDRLTAEECLVRDFSEPVRELEPLLLGRRSNGVVAGIPTCDFNEAAVQVDGVLETQIRRPLLGP
jgi:hypothetical protein